ncbi:hypothetical protein Bca52824_048113 [Brassica carinata]|uniref:Uncharacterized protein n=1 Tax=Brassica carinata TaxID=52824 RepID=A0A8X7URV7_BRACI|nr:hypothetical protein Bca52824_048113 [Brassica carinata]
MNGIEVNLEGVKYNLSVVLPMISRGHPREGRSEADTMIPRVSSKLSMLVSHTIFSTFGKISGDLVSGLYCKIVVQFEKYNDFVNAMKAFCGRSMKKEGTRLKENIGSHDGYRNEAVGYNTDDVRRKTFRE